jgi:superfamily I DNA/RNA helicase
MTPAYRVQMADSFQRSVAPLTLNEKGRLFDLWSKLQSDPDAPGLNLERVRRARDPGVWSARISGGLRAILWRSGSLILLLYAGHHDEAYAWAEQHRVDTDQHSGGLQLVTLPTSVAPAPPPESSGGVDVAAADAIAPPSEGAKGKPGAGPPPADHVPEEGADLAPGLPPAAPPFAGLGDDALRSLGVPEEWVPFVRDAASLDDFADRLAPDLPPDAADRLIALALGEPVRSPTVGTGEDDADAPVGRQFVPVSDLDELDRLLSHPLASWLAFLHPDQRRLAERSFNGPVKVTGSAGTGKTVLAMHRARNLARRGKRVLFTSYTNALCHNVERQLAMLCDPEELRRIRVETVHGVASQVVRATGQRVTTMRDDEARRDLTAAWRAGLPLSPAGLVAEWQAVIAPNGIDTWDAYRAVSRTGRGRALTVAQRRGVWDAVEPVLTRWRRARRADFSTLCELARAALTADRAVLARAIPGGVDTVVVDEVQDLGPPEHRLLAAIAGEGPDRLFLTGDGGQRIYARRLSLAACGVPVRGRSFTLRVNYRTTAQIRRFADRVLPATGDDLDGSTQDRRAVRSVLSGAPPVALRCPDEAAEADAIAAEIARLTEAGYAPDEIAVFTRTNARADELRSALRQRGVPTTGLGAGDRPIGPRGAAVTVTTLHRAKGLEYKAVVVAGASAASLPQRAALQEVDDPADVEDARTRERQLLYVGLTRARDRLLVTWTGEPTSYLQDALTAPGLSAGAVDAAGG